MIIPAGLFPPGVITRALAIDDCDGELFPEETEAIVQATPVRRREFIAGRTCARQALARLGSDPVPLPRGAGRQPLWPEGITGSIAHDRELCAVAVARSSTVRSLGIDLEPDVRLPEELVPEICSPAELERFGKLEQPSACGWPKLLFSSKEAVFKCLYPLVGQWFEFDAVELEPGAEPHSLKVSRCRVPGVDARAIAALELRAVFPENRILVACWLV